MNTIKRNMRLLRPQIVILLALEAGIVISFIVFANIGKQVEVLNNESFVVKSAANTVNKAFETMQMSVFRAISNDSQEIIDEAISDVANSTKIIQEQISLLKQNASGDGDIDTLLKLENSLSELVEMQEHVLTLSAKNKDPEASEYMETNNILVIKEAQEKLEHFVQTAEVKENELVASLLQTRKKAIILLIFFGAVSVLFSIWVGTTYLAAS